MGGFSGVNNATNGSNEMDAINAIRVRRTIVRNFTITFGDLPGTDNAGRVGWMVHEDHDADCLAFFETSEEAREAIRLGDFDS